MTEPKLADFLWDEGAQVSWIINLSWALATGSDRLSDPLESFLDGLEFSKLESLFGIQANEADREYHQKSSNHLAECLTEYRKEGLLAEIAVAGRENWTGKGWSETGWQHIRHVYAEDMPSLELKIIEAVKQVIEAIRAKHFTQSSMKAEDDR